ncbi:MAG: hypothetical protein Q8P15_03185 [Nanoarchaeota archaeon]|nr:hypothetical protein [Nanoarchaeota archaeon]
MNFQFYVEKLKESEDYKKFVKEKKGAFPCSGFFLIDKEEKKDKQHFDFYIKENGKMFSFQLENNAEMTPVDVKEQKIPAQISLEHDFDFSDIEKMIEKKMEDEKMNNKIQKILLSLQNVEDRDYFMVTVFITQFGLINATIDIEKMEFKDFKKRNFFDMMNILGKDK